MGYDARVSFEATIREGVTRQMVEAALQPLLDEADAVLRESQDPMADKSVALAGNLLIASVDFEAGYRFDEDVFIPVVDAIGALAAEPFEATREDQDTGDAEERYFTWLTGPAHLIPEFKSRQAREQLPVGDIVLPLSARGWPLEDLATHECMTIAAYPKDGHHTDAVSRVSVDLIGLELDEGRRDRIARLAVLLAREIAGDELILHPRPGYGAAERVLDAVGEALGAITGYDKQLNAEPAKAPEGSDYEALLRVATTGISRIRDEAVARADARVEPRDESDSTTDQTSSPRG
jgi:hypothetical protein